MKGRESNMTGTVSTISGKLRQVGQAVNSQVVQCQTEGDWIGDGECQTTFDTKGFKGKGSLRELRHWFDKLGEVEAQMVQLCQSSREAAPDVGAYLAVHRKTATGLVHLRWRERGCAGRHLRAEQVRAGVAERSEAIRRWFESAAQQADALNVAHQRARAALREQQEMQVRRSAAPIWPRAIS
ncbi:MAG: hypothetical protein LBV61_07680 [Burkholderiaceae bacterium]|nr:hypothetical protein [Burkholderiaceae bacterium]